MRASSFRTMRQRAAVCHPLSVLLAPPAKGGSSNMSNFSMFWRHTEIRPRPSAQCTSPRLPRGENSNVSIVRHQVRRMPRLDKTRVPQFRNPIS